MNSYNLNVFEKVMKPIIPIISEAQNKIPNDMAAYTLSLLPFTINIIFAIINRIPSVSLLVTEIKTSDIAKSLGWQLLPNQCTPKHSSAMIRL